MEHAPSAGKILFEALCTIPGFLIASGLLCGVLVFVLPLTWSESSDWRTTEKLVAWTDWGISIAAFLIAIGLLTMKVEMLMTYGYGGGYRSGLTGIFFYIAFRRVSSRIRA